MKKLLNVNELGIKVKRDEKFEAFISEFKKTQNRLPMELAIKKQKEAERRERKLQKAADKQNRRNKTIMLQELIKELDIPYRLIDKHLGLKDGYLSVIFKEARAMPNKHLQKAIDFTFKYRDLIKK